MPAFHVNKKPILLHPNNSNNHSSVVLPAGFCK